MDNGGLTWDTSSPSDWSRTYVGDVRLPLRLAPGRQLFVDDYLIAGTDLKRVWHHPADDARNPIFVPETNEEMDDGLCPMAAPFNDGIWFDDRDGLYKMWYMAGWFHTTALATSTDGIHWKRPVLDVVPGTNLVWPREPGYERDGCLVWLDKASKSQAERYKMFQFFRYRSAEGLEREQCGLHVSGDGVHWSKPVLCVTLGDNTSFFFNPFRKRWVLSDRRNEPLEDPAYPIGRRARYWHESRRFRELGVFASNEEIPWLRCDLLDKPDPDMPDQLVALYDVNAVPYESLMVGLFGILRGPENHVAQQLGVPKRVDLEVGFSRDGFHWARTERNAFIPCSRIPGSWNRGYIHAAGGCFVVLKDTVRCYYTAFSGISPSLKGAETAPWAGHSRNAMYAGASLGLATLRRDGFASMEGSGTLTTKVLRLPKGELWINGWGTIEAEILDAQGRPLEGFDRRHCIPFAGDSTCTRMRWKQSSLASLKGRIGAIRFFVQEGALYAFWFSADKEGKSGGYVAAGSSDYPGERDI